jgi:hypothetical protein
MPSIASRIVSPSSSYSGTSTVAPIMARPPLPTGIWGSNPTPIVNTTLRCPLPTSGNIVNPDNLRQHYAGGVIPQYRINPPNSLR